MREDNRKGVLHQTNNLTLIIGGCENEKVFIFGAVFDNDVPLFVQLYKARRQGCCN